MSWLSFPWRLGGRLDRLGLLFSLLIAAPIIGFLGFGLAGLVAISMQSANLSVLLAALTVLAIQLALFAFSVRRLHDIGLTGFIALPFAAVDGFLIVSAFVYPIWAEQAARIFGPASALYCAMLLVWPGQAQANRFGPPPSAPVA